MKNRMMPLIEQMYFVLLEGKSNRTIHVSMKNDIINFIKNYRVTKDLISIRSSGYQIRIPL